MLYDKSEHVIWVGIGMASGIRDRVGALCIVISFAFMGFAWHLI